MTIIIYSGPLLTNDQYLGHYFLQMNDGRVSKKVSKSRSVKEF